MALKKPSELFGIKEVSNVVKNVSNIEKIEEKNIEEEISSSISEIDGAFKNIQEKIQKSTQKQLQEYKNEFLEIYNYVDNIANEELPKYKKLVHTSDLRVESRINSLKKELYEKLEDHIVQTQKTIQDLYQSEVNQIKSLANNIEVVERYIVNHSNDIIKLREEVFEELNKTPINLKDVESKIEKVSNSYNIISEGLLNNPPSEDNLDPLTPLDQNFVTLEQLNEHYRLFLGRIQQQLSTLGGGGETKLKYLDDIVGIATNASSYDGKYLKYDHTLGKFVFSDVITGLTTETQTLNNVLRLGNDSSLGIDVGISTFNNSVVVGGSATALSVSGDVRITGILTVGSSSVTINGVDDILTIGSGVTISGSGSALYSGIITASSFYGDGSNLSGVVTSLVGYSTEGYVDNLIGVSTFSGDYDDLTNTPEIPSIVGLASEGYVDNLVGVSTFSGDYNDLTNTPEIPSNLENLSNVSSSTPSIGQVLKWSGSEWQPSSDLTGDIGSGIGLTDLSVVINSAGINSLTYNNSIGVFEFTPTSLVGLASEGYVDSLVSISTFSGDYNDLTNTPEIPSIVGLASEGYVDNLVGVSTFSGNYDDLSNTPEIPSIVGLASEGYVDAAIAAVPVSDVSYWNETAAGIHTLSNVGVGTTNPTSALTVKGNTSLETLNVSGVSTFEDRIKIGGSGDIDYSQPDLIIRTTYTNGVVKLNGPGGVDITTGGGELIAHFDSNPANIGSVDLYYDGSKKFETISSGVNINGTTFTDQLSVSDIASVGSAITMYASSGIISATTFYGDVVGNITGSITDATNLTGGYANASSLNVSGITTISQGRIQADASANLRFGNLPVGGSVRNIAIGDQVLSSLSGGNGRNIGIGELSYYNTTIGQYNIGIGVQAGQNITTGSYNVILGGYNGQTGLDIRTSSNNVVIADGQGNIRQYIDSSGNVGIKTTVVTEALTVAGVVSATSFYGTLNAEQLTGTLPALDGSALFGVTATGTGVEIRNDGTPVGTAATVNFGDNIDVTFGSGIATVGVTSVQSASTSYGLSGTPNIAVGDIEVSNIVVDTEIRVGTAITLSDFTGLTLKDNMKIFGDNRTIDFISSSINENLETGIRWYESPPSPSNTPRMAIDYNGDGSLPHSGQLEIKGYNVNTSSYDILAVINRFGNVGFGTINPTTDFEVVGDVLVSGALTASSFSGSGTNLTNLPAGQLTGNLPALDGSALLNLPAQPGDGIIVEDDGVNIGSARTVNFGTGLDVEINSGVASITASGGSLKSRTTVTGVTTSIANNGIGNTDITGFKSYTLMKVGLSTAGWLRIYTDSTSRASDISRSVGEDPLPGSGVIAEVVTTGVSTTQIISPFVTGGNLDEPASETIYVSIKNLSGSTQSITANLTILQLEA